MTYGLGEDLSTISFPGDVTPTDPFCFFFFFSFYLLYKQVQQIISIFYLSFLKMYAPMLRETHGL